MGTINSAFSIISGALDADQAALGVVANNVANANTTGYTEEVPDWKENQPIEINGKAVGDGVTETGSTSLRDRVLEQRLDQQQQLASASSTRLTALDNVQALFTVASGTTSSATAGNIGSDITNFFDSFSSLEKTTTSDTYRQDVISTASTLASDISGAASSLESQRSDLNVETGTAASQVNSLTSAIAELNTQITANSPNSDAGTLEDDRQADLSALSKLVGINQVSTENNSLEITTTSGELLISGGTSYQLQSGTVDGVTNLFLNGKNVTSDLASGGGELGGYLTARDTDIPSTLNSLDQLAYSISTSVNKLNNSGSDQDGEVGTTTSPHNIFNEPTTVAGSAVNMSVVITDSQTNEIATAGAGKDSGDDSNAVALAALAKQTIVDGKTPSDYYSSFVSSLGSTVTQVKTENTAQEASVSQLQSQSNALSSVNLNDEAASLSTLERSYQAASQVFTMLNTVLTSALNLGDATAVS